MKNQKSKTIFFSFQVIASSAYKMGNSAQKMKGRDEDEVHRVAQRFVEITERSRSPDGRKSSTGSSSEVSWTSANEDAEDVDCVLDDEHHLMEDNLATQATSDDFMKAVLSFCSYMDGRMDSLDNSKLYEEFCNYTASHSARIGVA